MVSSEVPINQRIAQLIEHFADGKQRRFAENIGVSPSMISDLFGKRQNRPGLDMLQKIGITYPSISMDWLISGSGSMLQSTPRSIAYGGLASALPEKTKRELDNAFLRKGNNERVGERIKALRDTFGLTINSVAERSGISDDKLKAYEQGDTYPDNVLIAALSYVYQIEIDVLYVYIFFGTDLYFNKLDADKVKPLSDSYQRRPLEDYIYPESSIKDIDKELLDRVRLQLALYHPWQSMSNEDVLLSTGLWRSVKKVKGELTLAAILLLGKNEIIRLALPKYKLEVAIWNYDLNQLKIEFSIEINLIDTYYKVMNFCFDYLESRFLDNYYTKLFNVIIRECVINMIVHNDYTSPMNPIIVFYSDRIEFLNPNVPHVFDSLIIDEFNQFSKNRTIARFFRQIGIIDEFGAGLRRVFHAVSEYSPNIPPSFSDERVFSAIIPLPI